MVARFRVCGGDGLSPNFTEPSCICNRFRSSSDLTQVPRFRGLWYRAGTKHPRAKCNLQRRNLQVIPIFWTESFCIFGGRKIPLTYLLPSPYKFLMPVVSNSRPQFSLSFGANHLFFLLHTHLPSSFEVFLFCVFDHSDMCEFWKILCRLNWNTEFHLPSTSASGQGQHPPSSVGREKVILHWT